MTRREREMMRQLLPLIFAVSGSWGFGGTDDSSEISGSGVGSPGSRREGRESDR